MAQTVNRRQSECGDRKAYLIASCDRHKGTPLSHADPLLRLSSGREHYGTHILDLGVAQGHPNIPAAGSALRSHPCVAVSSAQVKLV